MIVKGVFTIDMSNIVNFSELKKKIFSLLNDKELSILKSRFALDNSRVETLEVIGVRLGVTRERVRQIEIMVFNKIAISSIMRDSLESLASFISKLGGVASLENIGKLANVKDPNDVKVLNVLLASSPHILKVRSKLFSDAWRVSSITDDIILSVSRSISAYLKKGNRPMPISDIIMFVGGKPELVEAVVKSVNFLGQDVDGNYGFKKWGSICPRNTRDKAYVIFKRAGKPLHYKKLTELISSGNFSLGKKVSVEAVHNELIRDGRFVLVGRGIYALREWGYIPGTVSDVIEKILGNENRPMHKNEIVEEVLGKRFVRKNTILLNLQEKPQFERVKRAVYKLRKIN